MVTSKPVRTLAAAALSIGLALGATACSTPQTLKPYTPAEGVNVDLRKDQSNANEVPLKVRNLMVLVKTPGQGTVIGAVVAPSADTLTQVAGQLIRIDGSQGGRLGPAQAGVQLRPNEMVNLLDRPAIQVSSPDLKAGSTADLVLTFQSAGPVTVRVPVVDGTKADYATVSPSPAAGASATPGAGSTPGASPAATPGAAATPTATQTP